MTQYYLQNKHRGYLGNSPVWYGKHGRGYTAYLSSAERFDEVKAREMVKGDPDKWAMFKCDDVDQRCHLVFDAQDTRNLGKPVDRENSSWIYIDARPLIGREIITEQSAFKAIKTICALANACDDGGLETELTLKDGTAFKIVVTREQVAGNA